MTTPPVGGGPADHRDDAELLRAHVDGDPDAFAELVRRHRDRLWAVAMRTLGDREEAADAVQDALLSAYRSADRFRGDSAVTTWLHRIVVNACLDRARRRQARPTLELSEATVPATWGGEPPPDTVVAVHDALAQLPLDQRVVLVLLDMYGYPVAEIAAMLGVAEGTVKSRAARARARMAVLLGHLHANPATSHQAGSTPAVVLEERRNLPSSGDVGSSAATPPRATHGSVG